MIGLKKDQAEKIILGFGILMLLVYVIANTWAATVLYADGSENLYMVMRDTKVYMYDRQRAFFAIPTAVTVLAAKMHWLPAAAMARLYTFMFVAPTAAMWGVAFVDSYRKKKLEQLVVGVLLCSVTLTYCGFLIVSESISAVALFWCVFILLVNQFQNSKYLFVKIAVTFLSVFTTRWYQSFAFFDLLLLCYVGFELVLIYRKKEPLDFFLILNAIIFAIGIGLNIIAIVNPRDLGNRSGFMNSILQMRRSALVMVALLGASFLFFLFSSEKLNGKPREALKKIIYAAPFIIISFLGAGMLRHIRWSLMGIAAMLGCVLFVRYLFDQLHVLRLLGNVCMALAASIFVYEVLTIPQVLANKSFGLRVLNTALPFACAILVLMLRYFRVQLLSVTMVAACVLLSSFTAVFSVRSSGQYYQYLKSLSAYTVNQSGFTDLHDMKVENEEYCWGWPVVYESMFAHVMFYGDSPITGIVKYMDEDGKKVSSYSGKMEFIYGSPEIREYDDMSNFGIVYEESCFD